MNEICNDFDNVLSQAYQISTRTNLKSLMANRPMSVAAYSRAVGISVQSLFRFLRGGLGSYKVIMKIDKYIEDNK